MGGQPQLAQQQRRDSGAGNGNNATGTEVSKRDKELSRKLSCLSESERVSRGLLLSRILIIINPDLALAWNYRRDAFLPSSLEMLEKEQRLVALVMSRKPKCSEGLAYRRYVPFQNILIKLQYLLTFEWNVNFISRTIFRWLVKRALQKHLIEPSRIEHFISQEIDSIEQPIRRYSTNYHAWSYRFWLLELVLTFDKTIVARDQKEALLEGELQKSNTWIKSNVSDYSGCHYRQKLLECILNFRASDSISLLIKELDDNEKRILMYEGHESLWYHRRAVLQLCLGLIQKETNGNTATATEILLKFPPPSSGSEKFDTAELTVKRLQQKESDLVQQVTKKNCGADTECSQLNYSLCQAHVKWMDRRLKWDLTKSVHLELWKVLLLEI